MEKKARPKSALLCPMCNNYLVNSYRIPCGHTFCFTCLKNFKKVNGNNIACYSCDSKFPIPAQGIIGFESVSGSELLRERLYSKLSDDKKGKFYSSDPNLASSMPFSERPKSSGYPSKINEDTTYQRYSKYNQPESIPGSVRNVKRSRKSPSRTSSSLFNRLKNLGHNNETEDTEHKNKLSEILSKRSNFKSNKPSRSERCKTSYEFPHHSKIPETTQAEGEAGDSSTSTPSSGRGNIKGRATFRQHSFESNSKAPRNFESLFEDMKNEFNYTETAKSSNQNEKVPTFDYSFNTKTRLGTESQSNSYREFDNFSTPNFERDPKPRESAYSSYSRGRSSLHNDGFTHKGSTESIGRRTQAQNHFFTESSKTDAGTGGRRDVFERRARDSSANLRGSTQHLQEKTTRAKSNIKSVSSDCINKEEPKRNKEWHEEEGEEEEEEEVRSSKNFLDRFNNADMFNKRVLKMRISRMRYEKIMKDEDMDESLLLSEDEKEAAVDDDVDSSSSGNVVDADDTENIDPNIKGNIKSRKTKSQLTEEELKVNGRSLKDVIEAARNKYSMYLHVEEEEDEEKEQGSGNGVFEKNYDEDENKDFDLIEDGKKLTEEKREESPTKSHLVNGGVREEKEDEVVAAQEVKVKERPVMTTSEGVSLRWKVEKNEFGIPSSVLLVDDVVVVADYGRSCLEYLDSRGNLEHQVDGIKPFCLTSFARKPDKIYVADRRSKGIRVFDKYGSDVEQWENMSVEWMAGIGVLSTGKMCVLDRARCKVSIVGADGTTDVEFGSYGNNMHQLCMADFLTVDSKDRIVIADSGNHCIKMFDSTGKFVCKFGEKGSEDGQLSWPKGVSLDSHGNIIVADSNNNRISCFSPDGVFIRHLISDIEAPYNVHFDPSQHLLSVTGYFMTGVSFCSLFSVAS